MRPVTAALSALLLAGPAAAQNLDVREIAARIQAWMDARGLMR